MPKAETFGIKIYHLAAPLQSAVLKNHRLTQTFALKFKVEKNVQSHNSIPLKIVKGIYGSFLQWLEFAKLWFLPSVAGILQM
jgi:hypothetical protein